MTMALGGGLGRRLDRPPGGVGPGRFQHVVVEEWRSRAEARTARNWRRARRSLRGLLAWRQSGFQRRTGQLPGLSVAPGCRVRPLTIAAFGPAAVRWRGAWRIACCSIW